MEEDNAMKIIIAGNGKVGAMLTKQLSSEEYDITLIDSDVEILEEVEEQCDVMTVNGNCACMDVLENAGARNADLLIAVTGEDEVNLLCCHTAHNMNTRLHTIARVRNPEYMKQIFEMRRTYGLSMTINPEKQAAVEIYRLLKYPVFLKRDTFAKGRVEIVELEVSKEQKMCGRPLKELESIAGCKILVCSVLRGDDTITPDGGFIPKEGDKLFVTASSANLSIMLKNLGYITQKIKRVIICGGGRVSYYLAQQLINNSISVTIVERNYDRCVKLSTLLPKANVIHGDATNEFLLKSEGIESSDAVVTTTGLDELNVIVSLFGKSCGVPKVITKISRLENNSILDQMSLGSIISPKKLSSDTIVRYVRALRNKEGAAMSVHSIANDQAEAVEFIVDDKTKNCGTPLREIKLKKNILIVCINHKGVTEIPNGDSVFNKDDTVIIVTGSDDVIYQLNDIFQ